jgi:hypothetical protein
VGKHAGNWLIECYWGAKNRSAGGSVWIFRFKTIERRKVAGCRVLSATKLVIKSRFAGKDAEDRPTALFALNIPCVGRVSVYLFNQTCEAVWSHLFNIAFSL